MRTIERLVRQYPNKTGNEILMMVEQDRLAYEKAEKKRNKSKLALIKDFNENGAYFKSTFGLDKYRYDRFYDLALDNGEIYCSVETIVGFYGNKRNPLEFTLNREYTDFCQLDKYSIDTNNRITKTEFDSLSNYLTETFSKFWGLIDASKFK